jgi:NAD(P)-dependent dehydrogenase (short-subunit alcohol dehydrogenase family)
MLHERIAVVTGASRGIGRAVALALARQGADVACLSRDMPATERVAAEVAAVGRRSLALACDVTSDASVAEAVASTVARLGPVDVLVNNAGIAESAPFGRTDPAMWARHLDVNLTGTYRMIQAVLPGMLARRRGRIVNVASVAGRIGFPYTSAYCASKHGVVGLTRALAQEIATSGVTVNAVCPGWVDTEMSARAVANISARTGRDAGAARQALADMSPQKRLMTADEVAHAVVMLAADAAAGIHGQAIAIDGGGMQK